MSSPDSKTQPRPIQGYSLATIIFGSHLLLVSATIIVFAILACITAYRGVYERAESELLGAAELLSQQFENGIPAQNLEIPDAFFYRFGKAPRDQAYWGVWDGDGKLIGSGGTLTTELRPNSKKPHDYGSKQYVSRAEGKKLELFVYTHERGQLVVGRPLAKEFDAFGALVARIFVLAASSLIVTSITAYYLTRWIVGPINEFTAKAESTTQCELDSRLSLMQPTREMSRLAFAFNKMLEAIENAFERQKQFMADAAHELRTPVTIVLSQAEYSLSRERTSDEYRDGLETCRITSLHMKRLVEDLMALSRLDSGRLIVDHSPLKIQDLISEVADSVKPIAEKHGVEVVANVQPCDAISDPKILKQILFNLVANAIEYSPIGSIVTLILECDELTARLTVADQGQGISASDLPRVWNRFFRVDSARTQRTGAGVGLGLSLVDELVKVLHGTCIIDSAVDQGTKVTVCIPRTRPRCDNDHPESPR